MFKKLLAFAAMAMVGSVAANAVELTDYFKNYESGWNFYVMGYKPVVNDGILTIAQPYGNNSGDEFVPNEETDDEGNPKPVWYQLFIADGVPTLGGDEYTVTIKARATVETTCGLNMGWGWGEGQVVHNSITIPTEWSEVSVDFTGIDGNSCNVVLQPGVSTATIEIEWLRVSHEDPNLIAGELCLEVSNITTTENAWDASMNYNFATPLEEGNYVLSFDVLGDAEGKLNVWGTQGNDKALYGPSVEFSTEWTKARVNLNLANGLKTLNFVFGGDLYSGSVLYFDNFSIVKEGETENLFTNGYDFADASYGAWEKPGWHKTTLSIVNNPQPETQGVNSIVNENAPVEYYNIQGIRVNNPVKGNLYIVKKGNKAAKVIL